MKILGLCASQRKLGNSELLLKEMMLSFPQDSDQKLIRLPDLNITPCMACYACLPEDKSCVLKDDLHFLLGRIQEADLVLIASPVYYLGMHHSLKLIQDRLLCVLNKGPLFQGKKAVLLMSYGVQGWEGAASSQLNAFAHFLHLEVCGSLLVQAANPGEAVCPESKQKLRKLAADVLSGRKPIPGNSPNLNCPECGADIFRFSASGRIHCVYCNLEGQMFFQDGRWVPQFSLSSSQRFSPGGMRRHALHLEEIKNDYILRRRELNEVRKPYRVYDDLWVLPDKKGGSL